MFDSVYGLAGKHLDVSGVGSLFGSSLGWAKAKLDLLDAFSCGMVISQVACPSPRKGKPGGTKRDSIIHAYDAQAARPAARAAAGGLAILDEKRG